MDQQESSGFSPLIIIGAFLWLLVLGAGAFLFMAESPPAGSGPGASSAGTVATTGGAGSDFETAEVQGEEANKDSPELEIVPAKVGDFSFVNQNGETITNKDLLGKEWVASFIFTKCAGPCYGLTARVMKLYNATKETDVNFVSFTVDPERDTPEQLAIYAEEFGAEPKRWNFLTGDQMTIYRLILDSFKVAVKENEGQSIALGYEFAHSTRLMHVNKEGVIIGTYKGEKDAEVAMLRRVLLGQAETPKKNQFVKYAPIQDLVIQKQDSDAR